MKRSVRFVCLMLLAAVLLSLCAPALAASSVSDIRLNQVQQNEGVLTMYLSLVDSSGAPIKGDFAAEEFTVQIDDKMTCTADSITAFDPNTMGINYVFCIDVSKSLTKQMMADVHTGFNSFVDGLGPKDTVTVLTFGSDIQVKTRANSSKADVKKVIDAIEPTDNSTALYKGVLDAVDLAAEIGGRSAVIMITDGANDVEAAAAELKQYTKDSIFDSVTERQVPLYCIGLTDKNVDLQSLRELADATGGNQYPTAAADMVNSMNRIRDIMRGTYILTVSPVNTEGRTGFKDLTTFAVGYQNPNGPFVSSNELQQKINWSKIPAPVATPSATEVPQISLELDDAQIEYSSDGHVTITGVIGVEQGSVAREELVINVNGEAWRADLRPNGNDYIFSAEGVISASTQKLEVSAGIQGTDISSRFSTLAVATPAPGPSATPAPVLTLMLDTTNQNPMYLPGETLNLTGVIESKNSPVDPQGLVLIINDVPCEDVSFTDIGGNQYEFNANYLMYNGSATELNISAQIDGTEITTRKQRLYLDLPTPTPAPELSLLLDELRVEYKEGETVTVGGTITVNGEVDESDLGIYTSNGVLWEDAVIERTGDGSYHFRATNSLSGDVAQLGFVVKLMSNSRIASDTQSLEVVKVTPTPVAPATPVPTDTPEPTATVTPTVAPTERPNPVAVVIGNLRQSGKLWIAVAVAAVLLVLIVLLIVLLTLRANRNRREKAAAAANFDTSERHDDSSAGKTVRPDMVSDAAPTVGSKRQSGDSDLPDGEQRRHTDTIDLEHEENGTIFLDRDIANSGTIMSVGDSFSDYGDFEDSEEGGTQRIEEDEEVGGTQRIEDDYEDLPTIEIVAQESCRKQPRGERVIELLCDEAKTLGRSESADIVIDDSTVSSRHARLLFDGENVLIEDMGSTNGTKVNKEKLEPDEQRKLNEGDVVTIGKTTLTLHIGEPRID